MADADLTVDRLDRTDVDTAHDLSTRAGWSTRRSDWRRIVDLDAVDAFAGRHDGRLVATATLVRYGTRVGWIGMMLVHPERRRRGHGTRMLVACLDAAHDAGVATVGLDANTEGKPLYDANGFVEVADVTRWHGSLDRTGPANRVEPVTDPRPLVALDRRATGSTERR
ncbi:MAG: GNAT family N-acetyltransferase [Haloarculaceae archaeon]